MFSDLSFDFAGRAAIFSGVGSPMGIGRAILRGLEQAGARVASCDINDNQLAELEREQPDALLKKVDLRDKAQVIDFVQQVTARYDRIDILVNNAGIVATSGSGATARSAAALGRQDASRPVRVAAVSIPVDPDGPSCCHLFSPM